jgi:hypothetical protein
MSSGRNVVLRAGGQMVAFLIEKKLKITANPTEITNDDSDGFRTYADTASTYTAKIDLKGNAKTAWMRNAGLSPGVQVTLFNIELLFTGGTIITGSFYVAAFTEGGESGASRELTLTLESTGQWQLTNGGGPIMPPEVGITFGEYPYLASSAFSAFSILDSIELKRIPQPDVEPFASSAVLTSLTMPVTAVYNTAEGEIDSVAAAAVLESLTMPVTAVYNTAEGEIDSFAAAAVLESLTMPVTANYAEHELHDKDQFSSAAAINSLTLSTP